MVLGAGLPKTGVEAVVEGMARFRRDMDDMNRKIAETGQRAQQSAGGGLKAMTGGLGFLGTAAATALGVLGGFAASAVLQTITSGFQRATTAALDFAKSSLFTAARAQEMDVVLKLIGGRAGQTAAQLDQQVESIRDLGIELGTAQGLLTNFFRWNLNTADAVKLARVAQDAAVISQQNSSDALEGLMHGITTMNTLVLRTYGITLASTVTAQEEYAKSLGKTRDQLTEAEMIQAVLNAVIEQGTQIAGAYEAAMQTAGKRLRSVARLVDDVRVNVGTSFVGAFTAAVDIVTAIVKAFKGLTSAGGPVRKILDAIGGGAGKALEGFLRLFRDALPWMIMLVNERMPEVMDSFKRLGESIGRLFEAFGFKVPSVGGITGFLDSLIDSVIWLTDKGTGVIDWIADLKEGIQTGPIGEAIAGFLAKVAGFVQDVKDSLPMVAEKMGELKDKLAGIADLVVPVILANLGGIIESIGNLWATHGEAIMASLNWVVQLGAVTGLGAVTLITGVANALLLLAQGDTPAAMDRMSTSLQTFADSAAGLVGMDWAGVVSSWESNFAILNLIWDNQWQNMATGGATFVVIDKARELGAQIVENVRLGFEEQGGLASIWAGGIGASLGGVGMIDGLFAGMTEGIVTKFIELRTIFDEQWTFMLGGGFALAWAARAQTVGRQIVDGLAAGVRAAKDKLTGALKEIVDAAIAAIKKLLGIASPSTVFAGFGERINEGLAKGIQASVKLPEQAMALAVRHTIEPASRQRMVPAAAAAAASGATDNSKTIHLGQVTNNDGTDAAAFDLMMRDWLGA